MNKLIYKDKVYYFKRTIHPSLQYVGSVVVYVKNTGFFKWLRPYIKIAEFLNCSISIAESDETLKMLINEFEENANERKMPVLILDCSPEITDLYK